jgi:glycogen synthase
MHKKLALEEQVRRPRVAVIVPNQCNPDYRVIKQAECLAKLGYDVRVFCIKKPNLPSLEIYNGVEYQRFNWTVPT